MMPMCIGDATFQESAQEVVKHRYAEACGEVHHLGGSLLLGRVRLHRLQRCQPLCRGQCSIRIDGHWGVREVKKALPSVFVTAPPGPVVERLTGLWGAAASRSSSVGRFPPNPSMFQPPTQVMNSPAGRSSSAARAVIICFSSAIEVAVSMIRTS